MEWGERVIVCLSALSAPHSNEDAKEQRKWRGVTSRPARFSTENLVPITIYNLWCVSKDQNHCYNSHLLASSNNCLILKCLFFNHHPTAISIVLNKTVDSEINRLCVQNVLENFSKTDGFRLSSPIPGFATIDKIFRLYQLSPVSRTSKATDVVWWFLLCSSSALKAVGVLLWLWWW